jgi:hypothetical protein
MMSGIAWPWSLVTCAAARNRRVVGLDERRPLGRDLLADCALPTAGVTIWLRSVAPSGAGPAPRQRPDAATSDRRQADPPEQVGEARICTDGVEIDLFLS